MGESKRGRPPKAQRPQKEDLQRLYTNEGRSVREIALVLGFSKDMIARSLKANEIPTRPRARRSSLRQYDLQYLEDGIRKKGVRGFSRTLKIDSSTLLHHIKVRKGYV